MTTQAILTPTHLKIGRASFHLDSLPRIDIEPPRQVDDRADESGTGAHRLFAYGVRTLVLLAFATTTDSPVLSLLFMALGAPIAIFSGALVEAGGRLRDDVTRVDQVARVLLVGLAVITVCALAAQNSVWESLVALAVAYPWSDPPVPSRSTGRGPAVMRLDGDATRTLLSCDDRGVLERLRDRITEAAETQSRSVRTLDLTTVTVTQAEPERLVTLPRTPRIIQMPSDASERSEQSGPDRR